MKKSYFSSPSGSNIHLYINTLLVEIFLQLGMNKHYFGGDIHTIEKEYITTSKVKQCCK